jgi:sugar lactone lactonase YvrE
MRTRFWVGAGGAVAALAAAAALAAPGGWTITTMAGTGQAGFSGDGGAATRAMLFGVESIAVDGQGNVYITDTSNYRVRKVTPAGRITTFAGTGKRGFSGDGGPATSAQLILEESGDAFGGLAVDAQRNVYIADFFGNRVRKVSPAGIISTFAGTGKQGFGGDGGPATSAQFHYPAGLAVDGSGNVYIADRNNGRVRKVSRDGTITTIAGSGSIIIHQRGDGGPALAARLFTPAGVAVDRQGNVYISDPADYRVRKVSPDGTITTLAGGMRSGFSGDGGPASAARLTSPVGVAADAQGNVYIADPRTHRVRRVDPGGTITTVAGSGPPTGLGGFGGDGGPATSAKFSLPRGIAVDRQGNLYVGDLTRVRKMGPNVRRGAPAAPAPASAPAPATAPASSTRALRTFGSRVETYLRESARGRATLRTALGGVLGCSVPLRTAAAQVAAVTANRRGLLARLGGLNAPTAEARRVASLLRQALTHSVAADVRYEAWIRYLQGRPACSTTSNADLAAAQREDRLATAAKQSFVAAYNPLARRLGLRTWTAADF